MASFVFPDASAAGSGMGGLLFLRIRDVSVEDNFVDLGLHEEVWVPTEDLSSLICKTLFNVDYNDVDAIGTNLDVEGTNPLVYPIASLSSTPSLFKDIPNISSIEWVPLFFSETSGRYFYFGNKREIIFIDLSGYPHDTGVTRRKVRHACALSPAACADATPTRRQAPPGV